MNRLIELVDVYKIYNEGLENEVRALDGVNLTIGSGEFVAVVGASGSGKSTLMNVLGCLDLPTYGEYYLRGKYVSDLTDRELSHIRNEHIGFIFQGFNLIPTLTALENVELPLTYAGIHGGRRRSMAEGALDKVGLWERMDHRPFEMSGGQQQRVAIARAIVSDPPVIMADEPTGNLDTKTGEHVIEILKELNRAGSTIILITHDSSVAAIARRIIRISDGRIIEDSINKEFKEAAV